MSEASPPAERTAFGRWPGWLRPRAIELPGSGRMRLIETTLLVLVGLLLAIATVNDVVRQTHVNQRLIADLRTWRPTPATTTTTSRSTSSCSAEASRARGGLRQHQPRAAEGAHAAVPGDLGPDRERAPHGARRLVPAAAGAGRSRRPLRLLRARPSEGSVPAMSVRRDRRSCPCAAQRSRHAGSRAWWPLVALTVLAAALRFSTLDLQSFWYDEAFTPVHVLHPSLVRDAARGRAHREHAAAVVRARVGDHARARHRRGRAAPALGARRGGDRAASRGRSAASSPAAARRWSAAALVAVNPLFVWYSQEARAYALFVLFARAGDAVLPARAARAHARRDGGLRR